MLPHFLPKWCHALLCCTYTDDESDLVYYGYRYYVPGTGRWANRDPLEEKGGYNLHGMAVNDPVSKIDFLGLQLGGVGFPSGQAALSPSSESCCVRNCNVPGETRRTGEVLATLVPGYQNFGDPDLIDAVGKRIQSMISWCKKPPHIRHTAVEGTVTLDMTKVVSREVGEYQYGVKIYTILIYETCRKSHCGGVAGAILRLGGNCSEYHWRAGSTTERQCTPLSSEAHSNPAYRESFISREAAMGAKERCRREHEDEFDHPEKYIRF
ncbi:MAG: RHS repeat-associated core domain-containing protein [Verrucomicrobia bacterium]|nr:RHS repeat-associated core domain-containing protein [Verrucomicrobiota bacterium]